MTETNVLNATARCTSCSECFTVHMSNPVCESCFVKQLQAMVQSSKKKRWHFGSRKFAIQMAIILPFLWMVGHYFTLKEQLVCDVAYVIGIIIHPFSDWFADKF